MKIHSTAIIHDKSKIDDSVEIGPLCIIDEDVEITTIEGLSESDGHPVQQAWFEEDVPQCGYCQSGQIMTAAAFLERNPDPTDSDINTAMKMNICRCGSYPEIKKAIHRAAGNSSDKNRADNE